MDKFNDYLSELPILFKQLLESPSYNIDTLTEGRFKEILGECLPVKGVYLMYDKEVPGAMSRKSTN